MTWFLLKMPRKEQTIVRRGYIRSWLYRMGQRYSSSCQEQRVSYKVGHYCERLSWNQLYRERNRVKGIVSFIAFKYLYFVQQADTNLRHLSFYHRFIYTELTAKHVQTYYVIMCILGGVVLSTHSLSTLYLTPVFLMYKCPTNIHTFMRTAIISSLAS